MPRTSWASSRDVMEFQDLHWTTSATVSKARSSACMEELDLYFLIHDDSSSSLRCRPYHKSLPWNPRCTCKYIYIYIIELWCEELGIIIDKIPWFGSILVLSFALSIAEESTYSLWNCMHVVLVFKKKMRRPSWRIKKSIVYLSLTV